MEVVFWRKKEKKKNQKLSKFPKFATYAAYTHAGLTTMYQKKSCRKAFLCSPGHVIYSLWRG